MDRGAKQNDPEGHKGPPGHTLGIPALLHNQNV